MAHEITITMIDGLDRNEQDSRNCLNGMLIGQCFGD
jgi:hypothetical protein